MSGGQSGLGQGSDKRAGACLTEEDIQRFMEILADVSDKWDNIGIALGLIQSYKEGLRRRK